MYFVEAPRIIHEAGGWFGEATGPRFALRMHRTRSTPALRKTHGLSPVDYVAFASMFVPLALVRRIGLPQDVFFRFDDIEYCRRAHRAGYSVLNSFGAVYWHPSGLAKPETWARYYNVRNSLYALATGDPSAVRTGQRQYALLAAKLVLVGRAAVGRLVLRGLVDHARGLRGRVDVDARGFQVYDITTASTDELLRSAGADHLVVPWVAIARLLPPYRRLWLDFICGHRDAVYVSRGQRRGRWQLFRLLETSEPEAPRLEPLEPDRAAAVVRRSIYLRVALPKAAGRRRLRGFRKIMWLHGHHVIDSDRVPRMEKLWILVRCAAWWLWLWVRPPASH